MKPAEHYVHQALHGYSEGHRLLESSVQLPEDLARLMLRMSDLSGSNIGTAFEDYITGYPLTSAGMYALAKTWYAPEVPRPGCVWTHTLLIPEPLLETPSLAVFLALLKRPQQSAPDGTYATVIPRDQWLTLEGPTSEGIDAHPDTTRFLTFFYSKDPRPILIPAKTSRDYERMLFSVWSQQWPTLRARFTFSTGSLSARSLGGRPFDVQCVPTTLVRDVQLETTAMQAGEPLTIDAAPLEPPAWAAAAAKDARTTEGSDLRRFLWAAAEATNKRQDFAPLVQVYQALQASIKLEDLIPLLAELFPEPDHSGRLKELLLGKRTDHTLLHGYDESSVLSALGSSDHYAAFHPGTLALWERGQALSRDYPSARRLIGQLFRAPLNQLSQEILAGLISAMDPEAACEATLGQTRFLSPLVSAKPSLAASPQLWMAAGDHKRELLESVLQQDHLDPEAIKGIVAALLESRSDSLLHRAVDAWGRSAVFAALDRIASKPGLMSETCRADLTLHVSTVMDWVEAGPEKSPQALLAAAHIVAPHSAKIWDRDTRVWHRAFDEIRGRSRDPDALYLHAFLLALGLGNAPPAPLELIRNSFEPIYCAAWDDQLSHDAWEILDPIVPHLRWPNDWDKCERMRRGLVFAFVRHRWPAADMYNLISDPEILTRVLKSARKVDGGEAWFRT